jgi:hypothetical protein
MPEPKSDPCAHRFGPSPPLSIGVEEELLLLIDRRRGDFSAAERVLESVGGPVGERVSRRSSPNRSS